MNKQTEHQTVSAGTVSINPNQVIGVEKVESDYDMSKRLQQKLRDQRQLPFFKLNRKSIRYRRGDVEHFLQTRRVEAVRIGGAQ